MADAEESWTSCALYVSLNAGNITRLLEDTTNWQVLSARKSSDATGAGVSQVASRLVLWREFSHPKPYLLDYWYEDLLAEREYYVAADAILLMLSMCYMVTSS